MKISSILLLLLSITTQALTPLPPYPYVQVGAGEYQCFFIGQDGKPWGLSGSQTNIGTGNKGGLVAGTLLPLDLPQGTLFKNIAGVLHGGLGVDTNGNVWCWGDGQDGQNGDGTWLRRASPVRITTDNYTNPFTGIDHVFSTYMANVGVMSFAVKMDGTLWGWGALGGGMSGDGTLGTFYNRPRQIPVPGVPGTYTVKAITAHTVLVVLRSDGTVWTCGGNGGNAQNLGMATTGLQYTTLRQLTTLPPIVAVTGGGSFTYALAANGDLWGWGFYGHRLGLCDGYCPVSTPRKLTEIMNTFPNGTRIAQVSACAVCTHAILNDGSLWGWGDNAQGTVGNGIEDDYASHLPPNETPYSWDFGQNNVPQRLPVRIVPERSDFVGLSTGITYVFYKYAVTKTNTIYAWGRNKGSVIANGVLGCDSSQAADYANAWDVPLASVVDPWGLNASHLVVKTSPYCAVDPNYGHCTRPNCIGRSYGPPIPPIGTGPDGGYGGYSTSSAVGITLTWVVMLCAFSLRHVIP